MAHPSESHSGWRTLGAVTQGALLGIPGTIGVLWVLYALSQHFVFRYQGF